ncbi:hypothetical protein FIU94_06520 [Sulfitobacter sp. THAF37]|uniref:hypothetical protein n=1 Tax=Sulfitobacter sp. THAF37 TaxID=2587855 RepID=UPI001268AB19|nr:hypothetical protein [Sulfitobacter sp. THAF37]QFT58478.1 hypothetical protein FIU94_06520 [Sulfitobacter sp. THAF37]
MYRRFIATIAAASIAITAIGAVPAHAGDRDTVRALAAILGVAVVGKIIHDNNKKKKQRVHRQPAPVYAPPYSTPPRHRPPQIHQPRHNPPRYNPQPRPLPQHVNRKLLPKQCFQSFDTRRGKVRMFGEHCLQRNFRHVNSLPRNCQYKFGTPNGLRTGYEARCLRDAGYRLARG